MNTDVSDTIKVILMVISILLLATLLGYIVSLILKFIIVKTATGIVKKKEGYSNKIDMDADRAKGPQWKSYATGTNTWPEIVMAVTDNNDGKYVSGNKTQWPNIAV